MIVKIIKTGKKAAKKCRTAFDKKKKIMDGKKRELIKKRTVIEGKAEYVKETFKDDFTL